MPCHAEIGNVSRTSRQYSLVRSGNVGMSSDYGSDSPVEVPSHRVLFGCCLSMKIQDSQPNVRWDLVHTGVCCQKWTVDIRHKLTSQKVDHGVLQAAPCNTEIHALAWGA